MSWTIARIAAVATAVALLLAACSPSRPSSVPAPETALTVGVFEITSLGVFDAIVGGFEQELLERTGLTADQVTFVEENAQGDPTLIHSIARRFADSDADMIAVIGTPAVIAQAELVTDRPIIALAMGDPVGAGVAASLDAPGGNVTGSIDYVDPAALVDELLQVHPQLETIGTIYDTSNQNSQVWLADLRAATAARAIALREVTIATSADVEGAVRSLAGRSDAVLLGPDTLVASGLPAIGQVAERERLPLYAVGGDVTTPGLVATLGPDYLELGRLAGQAAAEVYAGTPAGEVAFRRPGALSWGTNPVTVERLGLVLPEHAHQP